MGARIDIRTLDGLDEIRTAAALFDEVWGVSGSESHLPPGLFRALTHAGNYAAGAFSDGALIGAIAAFLGFDGSSTFLHSHILGVRTSARGHDIGFKLKQHQRDWALSSGITTVAWTFDPLVRRNAFFNVAKLGADAVDYLENFYGEMTDEINTGDETDRMHAVWELESMHAKAAAAGTPNEPDGEVIAQATVLLDEGSDGRPLRLAERADGVTLCRTPRDIESLRRTDPAAATEWLLALRDALGGSMRAGYAVAGATREGWYVLSEDR